MNFSEIDYKIINTLRCLSVDMVDKANSGHPGMPLGCAPMMYILCCKIMRFNPLNPRWMLRDRFVLSNGHGCALLYSMLHLLGYDYSVDDLKNFRQLHSKTPGHPEYNIDLGIEASTGPLGQGIANGVGMAIASKKMGLDNHIFVMCGDGCLMEGISNEAASLAGHLGLNNLIVLYDDNGITIDGKTDITFTENTRMRFNALNWNVLEVNNGDENIGDIYNKLLIAKDEKTRPSIIFVKTTIGYGSLLAGKSSSHGSPLGLDKTRDLKTILGMDPSKLFNVDDDVSEYFDILKRDKLQIYDTLNNIVISECIIDVDKCISDLKSVKNSDKSYATRESSLFCLNSISNNTEHIMIGSADLAESNKMLIASETFSKNNYTGKIINYGIREHSMVAIANGISTYGILPIVGTFLVFINYCLCAIRMSAISKHKVIYVLTHDSILLGEDGPTHQPIESLTILRSIPDLLTIRPCDTNEVSGAYQIALQYDGPTAIILSRQLIKNSEKSDMECMKKGAYIILNEDSNRPLDLIIVATGSEIQLAMEAILELYNIFNIRLVSMPCSELFDKQDDIYKEHVLPDNIKKMSLETGSKLCWYKYVDYPYGIDTFGASGNINDLKKYYKFNKNDIVDYISSIISI
jgi:transketolase